MIPDRLPEPYRSHIQHNMRVCLALRPDYFKEVIELCRSRIASQGGIEFAPEHTHYFFNETPPPKNER